MDSSDIGAAHSIPVPASRQIGRRNYVDWARGFAVLLMIEAHTFDAWTGTPARASVAFRNAIILGGFAAPLFLWLAGVSSAFAAAGAKRRCGSDSAAAAAVIRRGLEIFLLAFLFRLQAFVLTPGSHAIALFRVDILNILGPSIAAVGVVWALFSATGTRIAVYSVAAGAVAMLTPVVRATAWIDALPTWVQWYIRPAGEHTTFTAFPWTGFVLAGAACGMLLVGARDATRERRTHLGLLLGGLGLVVVGLYTASRPSIYREASFWTSSPTYFAIRVGLLMTALPVLYALSRAGTRAQVLLQPVERLGRSSLFVYWVHVELVYGYATWPIHHKLPLWGTTVAFIAFGTLMFGAVLVRDSAFATWRARRLYTRKDIAV